MAKNEATPKAEELAGEKNVDIDKVEGSGKAGKVTASDVEEAADAPEVMYTVEVNTEALGVNTRSVRVSTSFGDRVFARDTRFGGTSSYLVSQSEYEALKALRTPATAEHPNGVSYVKGGKA